MRPRLLIGLAAVLATVVGGVAVELVRRRRELAGKAHRPALPAGPPVDEPAAPHESDEPISRETRFDELVDEEEQRRHAAARRLKDDPLGERLGDEPEPT